MNEAEKLLEKFARKNMVQWNQESFKRTHSRLHKSIIEALNEALRQPLVMVRSEQLPCSHCGRPLKEHSKDSKLCPDRMKNFEQGN